MLFPGEVCEDLQFPFVEDLVNTDTFCEFSWADDRGIDELSASACSSLLWDLPAQMHMQRAWQPGAYASSYAPDPLVAPTFDKWEHFSAAVELQRDSHPFDAPALVDIGTQFACWLTVRHRHHLRICREGRLQDIRHL